MLAVLLALSGSGWVLWHQKQDHKPVPDAKFPGETSRQKATYEEEQRFWDLLDKKRPVYRQIDRTCYVDHTKFKVTIGDLKQDNAFGGVLTDLMKLALNPPK